MSLDLLAQLSIVPGQIPQGLRMESASEVGLQPPIHANLQGQIDEPDQELSEPGSVVALAQVGNLFGDRVRGVAGRMPW
jgi:hypothetical protein